MVVLILLRVTDSFQNLGNAMDICLRVQIKNLAYNFGILGTFPLKLIHSYSMDLQLRIFHVSSDSKRPLISRIPNTQ